MITLNEFVATADSRETDVELMEAIYKAAESDHADPAQVWENPTPAQVVAITEIATNNGQSETTDYCWGAAGSNWACAMSTQ